MSQNSPKEPTDDPNLDSVEAALKKPFLDEPPHRIGGGGGGGDPDKKPESAKVEYDGVVQEVLPNHMFRVKADNGLGVLAHITERMLQYYISVRPGDRVTVEVSLYDPTRGVITYRHK